MNKLSKFVLISAVIAFTSTFVSSTYAGAMIYGSGAKSCGVWLSGNKQNATGKHSNHIWILGYVSAAGSYKSVGVLKHSDSNALIAWMDNYCSKNPLSYIHDAAHLLVLELSK